MFYWDVLYVIVLMVHIVDTGYAVSQWIYKVRQCFTS